MNAKSELEQQKIKTSHFEEKLKIMSENEKAKADLESFEKKAVSSEEKYNKMKDLYTKLRNEHVALLRQEADVKKQKDSLMETCEHANKMRTEFEKRLEEATTEKAKLETELQAKLSELQVLKKVEEERTNIESEFIESSKKLNQLLVSEKELKDKCDNYEAIKAKLESELEKYKSDIDNLKSKLSESNSQKELAEKNSRIDQNKFRQNIYLGTIEHCELVIKESLHMFDDPVLLNCKSGAEYLLIQLQPFQEHFDELALLYEKYLASPDEHTDFLKLLKYLNTYSNHMCDTIVSGKITSITAAALKQGEILAELCRESGQNSLKLLEKMKNNQSINEEKSKLTEAVKKIIETLRELLPKVHDINKEEIGDMVEQEMHKTSQAIEAAVAKLELLINKSKEQDTGVKLEVNDKILDSCTSLMHAIKVLIIKAKELQKEIVAQGRVINKLSL